MSLAWVDDVIRLFGDDALEAAAKYADNTFGGQFARGLAEQREVGRIIRNNNALKEAIGQLGAQADLNKILANSDIAAKNPALGEAAQRMASDYELMGKALGDKAARKEWNSILNSAIDDAKAAREAKGLGGMLGRTTARVANRAQAWGPGLGRMVADNVVNAAVFAPLMIAPALMGGNKSPIPQLTPEQLASLTPEELAQYEAMVQGY